MYSEKVMEYCQCPPNYGPLDLPDLVGVSGTPGDGPYLVIQCHVEGDVVQSAKFQSHGCGATIACGAALTQLILSQPIHECRLLTAEKIVTHLGGLPKHKLHCAHMAIRALNAMLSKRNV